MPTHHALLLIQTHTETEVSDLAGHAQLVLRGLEQHVVGLQVPVDDVIMVDMVAALGDV